MIIDVSHVHESTFWAVINVSKKPIIASHSDAAGLCPVPRNLTDNQIKAIADTGGMIGLNFYPGFLNKQYEQAQIKRCGDLFLMLLDVERDLWNNAIKKQKALQELGNQLNKRLTDIHVGIGAIIDHMSYMIDLVGDDHVGFGSDFDGLPALPAGMTGCDVFPLIIEMMRERGFSDKSVEKICFKNFIRVLAAHE